MIKLMTTPPSELSTQDKELIYSYKKQFEAFFKQIESDLLESKDLTNYKLVEKKGRRSWIDNQDLIIKTLQEKGVTDPTTLKLVSLTDVIKQIGEAGVEGLIKEGKSKVVLQEIKVDPAIEKPTDTAF